MLSSKAKEAAREGQGSSSSAASLSWQAFQTKAASLKATRSRLEGERAALEGALEGALARQRAAARRSEDAAAAAAASSSSAPASSSRNVRPLAHGPRSLVLVAGFESFNARLYELAAADACRCRPGLKVSVFCDADILGPRSAELAEALSDADAVFCSLVFDFDQVEWLKARIPEKAEVRLAFESALELMATTKLGTFKMDPSGKSKGPPPAVKKVLSLFGSGRVRRRCSFLFLFFSFCSEGGASRAFRGLIEVEKKRKTSRKKKKKKTQALCPPLTSFFSPFNAPKTGRRPPGGIPLPLESRARLTEIPPGASRGGRAAVAHHLFLLERRRQAQRDIDAAVPRRRGAGRRRERRSGGR